jgi:uncharacterized protein (TIGR03086 family)
MDDIALLTQVLGKTGDLIDGVEPDQWDRPTPCSEYAVRDLIAHMVGWSASFDAAANGRMPDGDPTAYRASETSTAEFRAAVDSIVAGWAKNGMDRQVSLIGANPLPAQMVFDMTVMEYLAHGWDLGTATGQRLPFSDDEAAIVLDRAKQGPLAGDGYRGAGKAFGAIVVVPESAPALDRFAGFMGRTP